MAVPRVATRSRARTGSSVASTPRTAVIPASQLAMVADRIRDHRSFRSASPCFASASPAVFRAVRAREACWPWVPLCSGRHVGAGWRCRYDAGGKSVGVCAPIFQNAGIMRTTGESSTLQLDKFHHHPAPAAYANERTKPAGAITRERQR